MKTKIKRLSTSLTVLIPVLAVSFLTAGLAKADYRSGYGSSHRGGHSSYNRHAYKGYHKPSYNKGYVAKKYSPKSYTVSVLLGKIWVNKYAGSSYSSAQSVAKYYRSRGAHVRF